MYLYIQSLSETIFLNLLEYGIKLEMNVSSASIYPIPLVCMYDIKSQTVMQTHEHSILQRAITPNSFQRSCPFPR